MQPTIGAVNQEPIISEPSPSGKSKSTVKRILPPVLVVVALVLFVVQNSDEVAFSWLFLDMTGPLWVVIIVAALAGYVLNAVMGRQSRKKQNKRQS